MKEKQFVRKISAVLVILCMTISPAFAIGFDAEESYNSVFSVYTDYGFGSGFAVGPNAIMTNAHVVESGQKICIGTYSGEEYIAQIYSLDDQLDLALIIVDGVHLKPLTFGSVLDSRAGDDVYAIGTPNDMALAWTLTKGVISSRSRVFNGQSYIQIDAAINSGNSGGPLLNDTGEVIGINTLKLSDSEGIGFSIPADTITSFISDLGMQTDENGNIVSEVQFKESTDEIHEEHVEVATDELISNYREQQKNKVLMVLLALSLILNVILIICSIHNRKTHGIQVHCDEYTDPSERTDFEIEIED